jgi:hypothetical protein
MSSGKNIMSRRNLAFHVVRSPARSFPYS